MYAMRKEKRVKHGERDWEVELERLQFYKE